MENGIFAGMVAKAGPEVARHLLQRADDQQERQQQQEQPQQ